MAVKATFTELYRSCGGVTGATLAAALDKHFDELRSFAPFKVRLTASIAYRSSSAYTC